MTMTREEQAWAAIDDALFERHVCDPNIDFPCSCPYPDEQVAFLRSEMERLNKEVITAALLKAKSDTRIAELELLLEGERHNHRKDNEYTVARIAELEAKVRYWVRVAYPGYTDEAVEQAARAGLPERGTPQ